MESLAEYLVRVMRQKNIDPIELAKRSGLTDSYIGRLRNGTLKNPTAETMVKLATGLEVNAHEVFTAASGVPVSEAAPVNVGLLFHLMVRLADDSAGVNLLRGVLDTPPDQRQVVLGYLAHFSPPPAESNGKPRKK